MGGLATSAPFHKTPGHAQKFETLSYFSVPSSLLPCPLPSYLCWPAVATGCFLHPVWPWGWSSELKFPVCRQSREGQQARASMSDVDLCFLFSLSGHDCFSYSFLYSSSNLYGKQNISYPWTCLLICMLSLWSWSVDVFVSLPSSPQVTLHLFPPFLPKHVARSWTLTLTFPK